MRRVTASTCRRTPMRRISVFEMGEGGPAPSLHVIESKDLPAARQGAGGVHHVAFRTPDETQYHAWTSAPQRSCGVRQQRCEVDRFYFRSLYFREPNGILFRDRHRRTGLCRPTSRWKRSARNWRCRRSWSRDGRQIEAGLKPIGVVKGFQAPPPELRYVIRVTRFLAQNPLQRPRSPGDWFRMLTQPA